MGGRGGLRPGVQGEEMATRELESRLWASRADNSLTNEAAREIEACRIELQRARKLLEKTNGWLLRHCDPPELKGHLASLIEDFFDDYPEDK